MYNFYMVDSAELLKLMEGLMKEYDALLQEREFVRLQSDEIRRKSEEIDRRVAALQQSLQGLSLYTNSKETPIEITSNIGKLAAEFGKRLVLQLNEDTPKTLTDCCRDILRQSNRPMSALQVRQSLQAAGFDFSKYTSNPLSSIHTTLKRLAATDAVETLEEGDTTLYRWKTSLAEKLQEQFFKSETEKKK
jgi:hypothetical protein